MQAPMAGGLNTPELASAVCESGGVGSFGFSYSSPEIIDQTLTITKTKTRGPLNTNFFVFQPFATPSQQEQIDAVEALNELPIMDGIDTVFPTEPVFPDLESQLEVIWLHRPEILSFHFGLPQPEVIDKASALGISIGITATNLNEALVIQRAGASFIVAQGIEAGGHRGCFVDDDSDDELPLLDLLDSIVPEIKIPLVAAGGVMDGFDLADCLEKGATAAQLGTAFLCCDEAGTGSTYRKFLLKESHRYTRLTRSFSGRRARGINNLFIELMENKATLPFPIQNTLTSVLRKVANKRDEGEYQSLWAGSGYAKIRELPVVKLIQEIEMEIDQSREKKIGPLPTL